MGDLTDFEKGQIVDAHMAGASITKTAERFGCSRASIYFIYFCFILFIILIVTTIKTIYKQLNAFWANWLALTW